MDLGIKSGENEKREDDPGQSLACRSSRPFC